MMKVLKMVPCYDIGIEVEIKKKKKTKYDRPAGNLLQILKYQKKKKK